MIIDELIKLSKIFKEGYTVQLEDNKLNQYTNYNKPFIVSYLTVIEIRQDKIVYSNVQHIPTKCIIGGWMDNNIFYIELNQAFKDKNEALIFAIQNGQKAIYDIRIGALITKYHGVKLWIIINVKTSTIDKLPTNYRQITDKKEAIHEL